MRTIVSFVSSVKNNPGTCLLHLYFQCYGGLDATSERPVHVCNAQKPMLSKPRYIVGYRMKRQAALLLEDLPLALISAVFQVNVPREISMDVRCRHVQL